MTYFYIQRPEPQTPEWLGVIDCLGYLVCKRCNHAGRGHRLETHVFDSPHSEEPCDYCGVRLDMCSSLCSCQEGGPGSYDGPHKDCPIHGGA